MNTDHSSSEAPLPTFLTATASLRSGQPVLLRPLQAHDAGRFGDYLCGLSAETRARYGPHPFDQATADAICGTLDPTDILRMVATIGQGAEEKIIAYVLLKLGVLEADRQRYEVLGIALDDTTDCTLAPSVADAYQNQGIGSLVMRHLLQVAQKLGRQRVVLWLGVQATNERAIHFYTKWGFRKVGEFYTDKNNFDMICEL
jgi:ribosomal protein S18 acetylase RimI-like enzyme